MLKKIKSGLIALIASSTIAFSGYAGQTKELKPFAATNYGLGAVVYKVKKFENKELETTPVHQEDSGFLSGKTTADLEGKSYVGLVPKIGGDIGVDYKGVKLGIGLEASLNFLMSAFRSGICETKQQESDRRPERSGSFVFTQIYPGWISLAPYLEAKTNLSKNLEIGAELGFPYAQWTARSGHDRFEKWETEQEEKWSGFGIRYGGKIKWSNEDSTFFLTVFKENYKPNFKGESEIEGLGALVGIEKKF